MHFHLAAVEEHLASAAAIDADDFALVPGTQEERFIGPRQDRPYEGHTGIVDGAHLGAEHQPSVLVNREMLDVAAEEIGLRGGLPEAGRGADGQRRDGKRRDHDGAHTV